MIISHIVTVSTQVHDPVALQSACRRLKLPAAIHGTTKLFSAEAIGWQVQLPEWRYPVVCDTDHGQLFYDNYEGRWGLQKHLDLLMQSYAVEKTILEARKQGHSVSEQSLADGSISLSVQVGGRI